FRGGLTLENYLSAEHLLVASDGGFRGVVDRRLESMDHSRRVVVSLPLFLPAMAMVAVSDLIGTLPARLVRRYAKAMEVTATEPPLEIRRFELKVVTHPRSERNRALQWMSDLIAERA
ncbi:MAG: LysR substrate-binding domain-containing protein, partial [Myxococcota bacterium]